MKSATFPTNQDHLMIGLPTPCNFYFGHRNRIAPSKFFGLLRHSDTPAQKEKTTTRDTKISLGYGRKSLGPKLGPGPISFPRENSCPCDIGNLKVLKYDQRALQTQNASQRDIALKSTSVMMNRFTDLQISTAQHDDWPPLRARQKLGRSGGGMWTGGVQRACMSE